jgi:hypothetical protein
MMDAMNKKKKIQTMPDLMINVLGIFVPILKELKDVGYQFRQDYFFNSSKFNKRFDFIPTSPERGIKETVSLGN